MKRFSLFFILFITSCAHHPNQEYHSHDIKIEIIRGEMEKKANKVKERICASNNIDKCPPLFTFKGNGGHITSGGVIFLNEEKITNLKSIDFLSFIIGHELAHIQLGHIDSDETVNSAKKLLESQKSNILLLGLNLYLERAVYYFNDLNLEYRADIESIKYMKQSGYNVEKIPQFIESLIDSDEGTQILIKLASGEKPLTEKEKDTLMRHMQRNTHPNIMFRKQNVERYLETGIYYD